MIPLSYLEEQFPLKVFIQRQSPSGTLSKPSNPPALAKIPSYEAQGQYQTLPEANISRKMLKKWPHLKLMPALAPDVYCQSDRRPPHIL